MCHIATILAQSHMEDRKRAEKQRVKAKNQFYHLPCSFWKEDGEEKEFSRYVRENQHIDFLTEEGNNVFAL